MKWIKCTDRKPENWYGVIIRNWVGTKFIVSPFMVTATGIKIPPQYDFIWKWDDTEWLDEVPGYVGPLTPEIIDQITEEIEAQHPYKVPGRHETFDRYNEGWADACSVLADRIKEALNK